MVVLEATFGASATDTQGVHRHRHPPEESLDRIMTALRAMGAAS
jgi:hypothetical protein